MNKIEKRSDLHREYDRVIDMCEGTNVNPNNCIKYYDKHIDFQPEFREHIDSYKFALAILEDRPVFVGDEIYYKTHDIKVIVKNLQLDSNEILYVTYGDKFGDRANINNLSWSPPKPKKICTIEGIDVFSGDTLYFWPNFEHKGESKKGRLLCAMEDIHGRTCLKLNVTNNYYDIRCFSLIDKPKTFNLNGVELPLPVDAKSNYGGILIIGNKIYAFNSASYDVNVLNAFIDLLEGK